MRLGKSRTQIGKHFRRKEALLTLILESMGYQAGSAQGLAVLIGD